MLGPKRLPGLARALGQGIREFRSSLEAGAEPAEPPAPSAQHLPAPPAQPQQEPLSGEPPAATTSASPLADVGERASGRSNGSERPRGSA